MWIYSECDLMSPHYKTLLINLLLEVVQYTVQTPSDVQARMLNYIKVALMPLST